MALSDEQRAMLRLLAQREQGYDDIAALMGLSVGEVRAKVVGALAQLEAEGEPRPDVPPPFPVAGEEGGPAAKPAAPTPPAAKEPEPAASEPVAAAPKAEPDVPKDEPVPPKAKPVAPKAEPPSAEAAPAATSSGGSAGGGGRTITIPSGRGLWPWIGAAAAIIAIVVVVILIAGGGGGGGDSSSTASTTTARVSEESQSEPKEASKAEEAALKKPTQAVLKPIGGGGGSGQAIFLKAEVKGKEQLVLGIVARGLEPTAKGEVYAVGLAQSAKRVLPIASTVVKSDGKVESEVVIPTEVLAFVASGVFDKIYLTRANNSRLGASLKAAAEAGKAPDYVGEPVLVGTVTGPLVGAAVREEEAQEAKEKE